MAAAGAAHIHAKLINSQSHQREIESMFRFNPSDEEIACQCPYLQNKVAKPASQGVVMGEVNPYACELWRLPAIRRRPQSSRSPEVSIHAVLRALANRETMKRESCTDAALVAKGNHARPDNDSAIGSSEKVVVCQPSPGLNASVETPNPQTEGGLVSSQGSDDHPAAADSSSLTQSRTPEPTWRVASAAPHHMTGDLNLLTDYTPMHVSGGGGDDLVVPAPNTGLPMRVHGSGSVNTANIALQDVLHVPGLDANLVSTSQLAKLGHTITLGPSGCRITKDDDDQTLVGKAHFTDDYLFELDFIFLRVVPSSTN